MEEEESQERPSKPVLVELGIELLTELLLFLYPYGAEQMDLPHSFWLGLGCWIAGATIAVRMFWVFPYWVPRRTRLEKSLIAFLFVGLFAVAVYRPVIEAYGRRNGKEATSVGGSSGAPPPGPAPLAQPPPSQPMPQKTKIPPKAKETGKRQQETQAERPPTPRAEAPPPQQQTIIAPNGIAIGGGVVSNPTVNNFAPPRRRISDTQKAEIAACLSKNPGVVDIASIEGNPEAYDLAQDWFDIFRQANWTLEPDRVASFIVGSGKFEGTRISISGSYGADNKTPTYDHHSPGGTVADCLMGRQIGALSDGAGYFALYTDTKPDHVVVFVGPHS